MSVEERLMLAPTMRLEQLDAGHATIYLRSNGARIRIPRALYELLLKFETPRTTASALGGDAHVAATLAKLRTKGFLVGESEAEVPVPKRLTTDPPVRLFDCPAQKLGLASTDMVAIGVPYDLSDRSAAGARNGPMALRETSLQVLYGIDRLSGEPRGWYDADRGRPILKGVSIADCGDVFVDPGESQADLLARITAVLTEVVSAGCLPVLLGGDAAITFPAIRFLQARSSLAVIHIGCIAPSMEATRSSFVTPSVLADHLLELPGVTSYVHLGDGGHDDAASHERARISAVRYRADGIVLLEPLLKAGQRVYLCLDLNALQMPGDTQVDNADCVRFSYPELHALLCEFGARYSIAGLGLVGSNPSRGNWGVVGMTAIHLLLTAMSAAKDRHEQHH
jgi:agmatinase